MSSSTGVAGAGSSSCFITTSVTASSVEGCIAEIKEAVALGVDMFDCVLPTRVARNGLAFTPDGPINLRNERFRSDPAPIVEGLDNYTCRNFSRAYLRHLIASGEMLGGTLVTIHNLHFFRNLMAQVRAHIEAGDFGSWHTAWIKRYEDGSAAQRPSRPGP